MLENMEKTEKNRKNRRKINAMKATGIVRRIDDLGRVVVPKEIRRTLRIREGDPLEIFTDKEGEIILKKYSPIGELSAFAKQYAESLSQMLGCLAGICDMDQVVAAAGNGKKELQDEDITRELGEFLKERKTRNAKAGEKKYVPVVSKTEPYSQEVISPILCAGDVIGAVLLLNVDQKDLFEEREGFLMALNGVYLNMNSSSNYGGNLSAGIIDVMAQYYNCTTSEHNYSGYQSYAYDSKTSKDRFETVWKTTYSQISNLNAILEHCGDGNPVLPELYYKLIKGEALGLRAMLHFDMLRLFGPLWTEKEQASIPYQTSSERIVEPLLSADSVLNCVLTDLTRAADLLKDVDPVITDGARNYSGGENGNDLFYRQYRMNYYAVKALMARAYMWKEDYSKAKECAIEVIEEVADEKNPLFPLCTATYADTASNDNMFATEVLFSLYNSIRTDNIYKTYFTSDLNVVNLLTLAGGYQNGRIRTIFESPDDLRFKMWESVTKEGKEFCCFKKYAEVQTTTDEAKAKAERFAYMVPLIRVSELYLIAAECVGVRERQVGIALEKYLNPLRKARKCISLNTESPTDLNTAIRNEYIREFIGEGQTFYYFKRNRLESIPDGSQPAETLTMQLRNYVVPLPDSETSQRENQSSSTEKE